jgi:putative ABC transport system permease protein
MDVKKGTDLTKAEKDFIDDPEVISVLGTETTRKRIDDMMSVLNLVVLLVISSAAILSFVVLFNLSNINIIERVREIATVKVLGFYDRETRDYVFRENAVFTLLGIVLGIPIGILLLKFVMMRIQVDMVDFTFRLKPLSYVYSIVITIAFTCFTNLIMSRKVDNIDMTTSLKSAE